jgi:hypothetical protein
MFILMSSTIETKYIPMICDKSRTTKLELFGLEIQMKNLDMVRRRPRVEETTIAPTWNKIETKNVLIHSFNYYHYKIVYHCIFKINPF